MVRHVVVIGAGAVGAASALAALKDGHRVTILDPAEPGGEQAASYGNGCWLSPMSVIPPAVPGIWKKLPKFLADPLGPLAIRWSYLPKVAPWLIRYLASGWRWEDVAKTAHALRPLVQDAPRLHKALADQAGVGHLIERRGLMYIYPSRTDTPPAPILRLSAKPGKSATRSACAGLNLTRMSYASANLIWTAATASRFSLMRVGIAPTPALMSLL